jgi:hypothetical protein
LREDGPQYGRSRDEIWGNCGPKQNRKVRFKATKTERYALKLPEQERIEADSLLTNTLGTGREISVWPERTVRACRCCKSNSGGVPHSH